MVLILKCGLLVGNIKVTRVGLTLTANFPIKFCAAQGHTLWAKVNNSQPNHVARARLTHNWTVMLRYSQTFWVLLTFGM